MIPTYNCDDLFEVALQSVLSQDPGPGRMQIAVVDDNSRSRYHEEVIERLAPGRVELYRQSANVGLARNWNECVERSRGRWVHILHQDDLVLPGFYEALARAAANPAVGAAFCRQIFINRDGGHDFYSVLHQPTAGVLPDWLHAISRRQYIQCASIVVRRAVYEQIGGYSTDLCFALDWEMWVRIAANYPVWFDPRPLACYRLHDRSETKRLKRADLDIVDVLKAIKTVQQRVPAAYRSTVGSELLKDFRQIEMDLTYEAFREGNLRTGIASFRRAIKSDRSLRFSRLGYAYYKWALKIGLTKLFSLVSGPRRVDSVASPDTDRSTANGMAPDQSQTDRDGQTDPVQGGAHRCADPSV
jgi:glycosyltransferase involved in cell wall biosynthesis